MGKKRNKVEIFKLEDRVLFEAGAVVQAAEAAAADQANNDTVGDGSAAAEMQSDNNQTASNELTPDNLAEMPVPPEMSGSDNADDASAADFAADPESETVAFADAPIAVSETSERILVVLNSSVADADSIVNDLGDNVEVLRLEAGTDALDAINDYLDEHADTKYSAIHLVSHGSEGYITPNGEKIDSTTINPADWKAIGDHLTDDADILVYGCDTAKSDEGKALVQTIANLTGADVAASIDSTGAHGDWDLEYRSGLIEAATIAPQYSGRLASEITVTIDGVDDFTELQTAIADVEAGGTIKFAIDPAFAANKDTDGNAENGNEAFGIDVTAALTIDKSITINGDVDGDGDADVILDANQKTYFFKVSGSDIDFTINGLILQNSKFSTKDTNGGAINISGTGVTFNFVNSTVTGSTNVRHGAAIFVSGTGAELNITDSVFGNNKSTWTGAAIYVGAVDSVELNVIRSVFADNTIGGGTQKSDGGTISLITVKNAKVWIKDSEFKNNTGTGVGGAAFGYYNASAESFAEITITGTDFSGNNANSGGAIRLSGKFAAVIDDCTFTGNTATAFGGAIAYAGKNSSIEVTNSTFTQNAANGTSTSYHGGGAIAFTNIDTGSSTEDIYLANNTFTENTSATHGGAISVRKMYINKNNAWSKSEGVFNLEITGSEFTKNASKATSDSLNGGGAIFFSADNSTLLISNSEFTENTSQSSAGAVFAYVNKTIMSNNVFRNNSAVRNGGALFISRGDSSSRQLHVENSLFDGNHAGYSGGAVFAGVNANAAGGKTISTSIVNSTFINNSAYQAGGALYYKNNATSKVNYVVNSTFLGNSVTLADANYKNSGGKDCTSGGGAIHAGVGNLSGLQNNVAIRVNVINSILLDNTADGVASDLYAQSTGKIYAYYSIYNKATNVNITTGSNTTITAGDLFDLSAIKKSETTTVTETVTDPETGVESTVEKEVTTTYYVTNKDNSIAMKELVEGSDIYNAVNRTDFEVGSYVSGNTILYNYRVKNANGEWNSWSSDVISVDQNSDIRLLYYTAGATQYNPALMWSEEDGIVTATWTSVDDAVAQLESGDGEYYFSPKAQDFGDVAVNGSLILHGFMPDSELKINLVLDSATDMVTVTGMKYTGGATISAGNMTIENALLMGEGNFTVTGGVFTAVNTTVSGFSGTITVDAANGIGQIVDSTLYDNSGTITGSGKLNILNSLVFGTENLSGYTAKFSVFDIAGTDAFNTYSAKANDVFGTELVWEDLTLTSLTASASSIAPHVNGAYAAVDGANLYYSTDRVNWKNFADGSAAAVNDASVIKTDGQGNIRIVMAGKASVGAYAALMEAASLTVTVATDVVDAYDGYISLREAVLYAQNGEVAMNFDSNGDGTMDAYRITFDAAAIAGNTDDGYTMRPNEDGKIYIDLMVSTEGYSSALVFGKSETFVIDGENQNIVLDISQGTAGRVMEHSGGSVTIKNLALYGTGAADKQSTIASGGLVYLTNGRTFTAENVEFAYSRITSDGANSGAVFSNNGTLIINNSIFHHNNAVIASTTASTTIKVTGGRIYDNTASQNLIQGWNGSMTYLTNVEIDHNKTGKDKHIIYYERSADFYLDQVNVHDNTGGSNASAFLCVGTGQSNVVAKITNSAFYDNTFGRLIWFGSAGGSGVSFTLADSTIYNNTFNGVDDNRYIIAIAGNSTETYSVNVYNNTIAGNTSTQNVLYALQFSTNNDVSLLNNIILDNHGTADTGSMSVRIIGSGANVDAYGNIYETASVASTAVLNGKTMTAVSTDLGNHNTLSTVADVFGTEDLSTVWDGKTLAISADGAAADSGVLVGKIGSTFYVMQDGKWYAAATQAYYADFALDAAAGYGLGSTATVYTTAQNTVADGENQVPADRLYSLNNGGSEMIQVGAYALQIVSTEETLPVIVVPGLTVSTTYGDAVLSLSETQKEVTVKVGDEDITLYLDITWKAADGIALDGTQNAGIYKNVFTIDTITVYDTLGTDVTAQYKISSFVSSSFEVAKKAITVNANRAAKNYGVAEDPALSYRVYGLVGSDTLSGELARVAGEEVGTYEIQIGTLGADNTNYEITFNSANFTIRPEGTVAPVITLDSSYTYKGNNVYGQAIDLVDDKIAHTVQVDGADVTLYLDVEWMAAAGIATDGTQNAGTVEDGLSVVYVTAYADDGNGGYTDVSDQYDFVYDGILADLVVKKATVTVSGITAESKEYNGLTDAVLNYDGVTFNGLVNGDNLTVTAAGAFADANADTGKTVNLSGLTLGGDSLANYELAAEGQQTTASADITAKTITVKADDIVIKEGETAPALTYTVEEGGLVGEDKLTGALEREAGTGVGTYQINQGTLGVADTNYLIEFTPGIFKIEPANPQIFITVDAYAATNTYGEALSLTETGKEVKIMVEGEEKTFYLDIVWKTDGTVAEDGTQNAGTYEDVITIHSVTVFEKDGENYKDVTDLCTLTLPAETADLVIGKASLTVTADAKSITVGGAEPELTYTVDGLKNGDVFTGTLVRAEGTAAGVYAITLADGYTITNGTDDKSANYDFTFVGADLSIKEAASLTVTTLDDVVNDTDGVISFREAFAAANNKTASLAVNGVYTITFSQSLTANYDSDGDTVMDSYRVALSDVYGTTLSSSSITLVIDGSIGTDRVTIAGPGTYQLMGFDNGTITLQDMIITGGNLSTSGGAVKANTNGGVTIRNVLFTGNKAGNGGAAIYVGRGTLNIYDSEFTGNTANNGGVFYQGGGTLNVYNSIFTGNTGSSASVYRSHGNGTANFVNSVFYGNNSGPAFELAGGSTMTLIDCIVADNGDANDSQIKMNKAGSVINLINTVVLKGTDNTADAIQISSGSVNLYYSVTDADYSATANFSVMGGINNATFADTLEIVDGLPQVIASSNAGKNGVLVGRDAAGNYYVYGKNGTGDAANWISVTDSNTKIAFDINAAGFGLGEGATTFMNEDMKLVMVETLKAKADPTFFAGTYRTPEVINIVVNDASDMANTSLLTTTLREALAFCTTVGTKYNIVFANGVNNEVNLFESGDVTIYMSSGKGYSLSGKVNVTIDGSGDGKDTDADGTNNKVILDGRKNSTIETNVTSNRYRIIHAGNADLTLKNMTMQYGYTKADKLGGGAVYSSGGTLTVQDMVFTGNQTNSSVWNFTPGAAISTSNSVVTISKSLFDKNTNTGGGGSAGGAVNINGGTVSISDSKFTNNTSIKSWSNSIWAGGGAVALIQVSSFSVTKSHFEGNTLAESVNYGGGGAIVAYKSGAGTITGSTFIGNKVNKGGNQSGGGALSFYNTSVAISDSTFTNNISSTVGSAADNMAGGGAIIFVGGTSSVTNCTFTANSATATSNGAGGAISAQGTTLTVENVKFDSNSSLAYGGAMAVIDGKTTINNSVFTGNTSAAGGGGVYWRAGGSVTMTIQSSTFYNNSAAHGGAIEYSTKNYSTPVMALRHVTIAGNTATNYGGGIAFYGTVGNGGYYYKLNVYNSLILGNTSGAEDSKVNNDIAENAKTTTNLNGTIVESVIGTITTTSTKFSVAASTTQIAAGSTDYGLIFNGKASADYTVRFNRNYGNGVVELYLPARDILQIATTANPETDQLGNTRTPGANGKYLVGAMDKLFEVPSLVVNTTEDVVDVFDGLISLREAIAYQKADPTLGNTITFSDQIDWSTTDKTITLDAKNADGNYLGEIMIASAVTIDGSLMFGTVAQGIITIKVPVTYAEYLADNTKTVSAFRVFNVSAKTTLRDMIVKGGLEENGGGIYASGYLVMENMMVAESGATSKGGGVYIGAGVYAENVTIYNNTLTATTLNSHLSGGGGMFLQGVSFLVNSTFVGNSSKNTWVGGGALYTYNHPTYLIGCTVTGNTSASSRYAVATVNQGTPGPSIYIINSIVTGNTGKDVGTFNTNRNNIYFADSIYGTLGANAGDPNVFRKYNSRQITDATQVFGATTELLTDENGIHYIKPIAGPAGFGGKDYQILIFDKSANAMNTCAVIGYFGEDGYFYDMRGQRLLLGRFGSDLRFNNIWATADGENFSYMKETGRDNNLKDRGGVWMYRDYNAAKAKADLSNDELRNLCYITADGLVQAFPEAGSVTLSRLNPAWMKTEGQPASDVFKSLFITDALVDRFGNDRENTLGAVRPDAETASLVVSTDVDRVCKYDGVISLREAVDDYSTDGDTVTFADALTEVTLNSGLTISKNLTFTDDNMKISGAALTVADTVSLTISSGSKFEIAEGIVNNGTLANNGNLKLAALSGTGSLLNNGTTAVTGNLTQAVVTNNGAAEIGGNLETTGTVTNGTGAELIVTGTFTAVSLDNSGKVTANSTYNVAGTTDNKSGATLKVEGAFNGGTVNNAGNLDANNDFAVTTLVNTAGQVNLAGAANTVTDLASSTLGNVTYDGATAQQIITGTYAALILSGAGTKTATGNITASSIKNESETTVSGSLTVTGTLENTSGLKVGGDFAGGTLTNNGSLNLAGANNTATGTLGNVTYDGTNQNIITGTYGNLTISSIGTATANGDLTATTTTVNSGATLDVNGNFAGGTVNNTGAMTLSGATNTADAGSTLGNVTYNGAGDQAIIAGDYGDLVISTTGTATVNGNLKAETTTNSATLDVNGNFAGGTVNNTGAMTLAGATNSGTGTLGDVTYDGTADQQIIASENYGDLVISTTGTATVNGNLKAETTTNSATLDVNGNFAGGTVTNTGSMTLAGETNSGSGNLGNVTYDGADQQVIAGTYGNLTINSTGKASATGNISAAAVDNNANTEVTGNLTTTGDLESVAALKIGGSVESANITTTGEMEVANNLTATGTVDNDAVLTVGGNFSAATTDNSSDLKVSGNYTADTTTTSGTLDVNGNFSGGDVTNTGAMTLSGASNTANANSTLGDVTYDGTTDQQVIAGTYEDLVISTTGKATVNGDVSAATVKSDADTAITGNLTATGTVDSDAALTVGGNLTADTADNSSVLTVGGTFTANTTNNSGTLDADGDLNAGALTNSGNISVAGAFATTSTDLGAVEYDGTAAQNVVEGTYSDLSLTGGNKSLTGAVTVTDSLTADANIDTAGQDLTLSGDVAGTGTISTSVDSGTVTYDGTADQNILAGAYNNLALANGTKTLNSAASTTVNDTFTTNSTTIQSDTADVLASLTVKDAGNDNAPSSAIAGTNFNGIALNNTGSADGYLYVNADTNNADDATTGVYLVGNVFVAAEGIIYGDTLGEVYITVTNGNGDVIGEGTADELGWTWAVGNDAIENATTGTAYELISKEGFKFRFHGDVDVVIGKRAITVKADDLEIDTGDDPVFTYTYVGGLVGTDTFTGELASEGDGSKPGDFEITQGTLTLGDNYDITFIGGVLTVEGGGQDAHQFPNYNNPGNFAGVYDAPVHSMTHSYNHHESVPTLEHQNDRSIGFLFSVSNKQLGDASGAFGDNAPQGADVNIHAHTLSNLLKSYDKSEQIIASPANEIEDAQDDMKDLHDFSNNPFGILPDDEDLHTRAYDESIDFTVIGEDNLSTAKAEQFKDEFDAALEELLSLV